MNRKYIKNEIIYLGRIRLNFNILDSTINQINFESVCSCPSYFITTIMAQRLTYRRRLSYRTESNKVRMYRLGGKEVVETNLSFFLLLYSVKTPGGKLVYQYVGKRGQIPKCGECGVEIAGIKAMRPIELKNAPRCQRTTARAYGSSKCHKCVRTRIIRAFLIEEQKTAKLVYKKQQKEKKGSK
ncbi:S60 ribosomal protein L34 [Heterostelium album PN500]|uniref:S60 ribosomal protein L34 n=1 Tax=Heterostelium pallidum (strain ATCC 26659 / Pp 5 / PN500) TaxID=670386 RepID=D3BUG2_HETP5|nr:S60 ribosomal protein L34 [Heterostelium album PN500]EFA74750.1 S60 ribosomal protein L34 [Heterostelium album PN500]|eukprot:XP_020426884.1 S60 ribosomal protein L34 [Heterostelium album PN500]